MSENHILGKFVHSTHMEKHESKTLPSSHHKVAALQIISQHLHWRVLHK